MLKQLLQVTLQNGFRPGELAKAVSVQALVFLQTWDAKTATLS